MFIKIPVKFRMSLLLFLVLTNLTAYQAIAYKELSEPAVLITDKPDTLKLFQIAERYSPALWMASDERYYPELPFKEYFINHNKNSPIKFDLTKKIYYAFWKMMELEKDIDPLIPTIVDLFNLSPPVKKEFTIRYLFYFAQDIGFGGHKHDVEKLEITLEITYSSDTISGKQFFKLYPVEIKGLVHGSEMYSNILTLKRREGKEKRPLYEDLKLPINAFVERGKHAICPDRNRDGRFNLGYDVNLSECDAWCVRDNLGGGYLGEPAYRATMTIKREEKDKIYPEFWWNTSSLKGLTTTNKGFYKLLPLKYFACIFRDKYSFKNAVKSDFLDFQYLETYKNDNQQALDSLASELKGFDFFPSKKRHSIINVTNYVFLPESPELRNISYYASLGIPYVVGRQFFIGLNMNYHLSWLLKRVFGIGKRKFYVGHISPYYSFTPNRNIDYIKEFGVRYSVSWSHAAPYLLAGYRKNTVKDVAFNHIEYGYTLRFRPLPWKLIPIQISDLLMGVSIGLRHQFHKFRYDKTMLTFTISGACW